MPVEAAYVTIAINLVMTVVSAICLAVMGNRIGLEVITGGGGRLGVGWEAGVAIATFTIFFTMITALICISRKLALSWTFTVIAMLLFFATVVATAVPFHEI